MRAAVPDLESFARSISFRLLEPQRRRAAGQFMVARDTAPALPLLEVLGAPFDAVNTEFGGRDGATVRELLRPLLDLRRMSTMALAGMVNRAVGAMREGQAFVNVGVWHGFTLFAAMAGNPGAACIGIDDFSQFGGPRDTFRARFDALRSDRHEFFEMDYQEYFDRVHRQPIGVYMYDGEHSYDNQLRGLETAERFFANGCIVLVDDTNWEEPRQATLDFIAQRERDYEVLVDVRTGHQTHPTFWNGLLVVRKRADGRRARAPAAQAEPDGRPQRRPGTGARPAITLIVLRDGESDEALARIVEAALAQSWTPLEVIVADTGPRPQSELEDRVGVVRREGDARAALSAALERSSGSVVSFADCAAVLEPDAVELSVAYPRAARFSTGIPDEGLIRRLRAGLAAGDDVEAVLPPGEPFV